MAREDAVRPLTCGFPMSKRDPIHIACELPDGHSGEHARHNVFNGACRICSDWLGYETGHLQYGAGERR